MAKAAKTKPNWVGHHRQVITRGGLLISDIRSALEVAGYRVTSEVNEDHREETAAGYITRKLRGVEIEGDTIDVLLIERMQLDKWSEARTRAAEIRSMIAAGKMDAAKVALAPIYALPKIY